MSSISKASADPARRTAVVETASPLALMYLHNNLHVVHHAEPTLPWYAIPARWEAARDEMRATRPDLVHPGYLSLALRYGVQPKEPTVYPV